MESFKVVRPEHLNHYGYLFGGFLLKWVDEISWIAASRDHPGCMFVTVGMDRVEFHRSVRQGAVLRFDAQPTRRGTTSVQYEVNVYADDLATGARSRSSRPTSASSASMPRGERRCFATSERAARSAGQAATPPCWSRNGCVSTLQRPQPRLQPLDPLQQLERQGGAREVDAEVALQPRRRCRTPQGARLEAPVAWGAAGRVEDADLDHLRDDVAPDVAGLADLGKGHQGVLVEHDAREHDSDWPPMPFTSPDPRAGRSAALPACAGRGRGRARCRQAAA